jgi:hypothetical protein
MAAAGSSSLVAPGHSGALASINAPGLRDPLKWLGKTGGGVSSLEVVYAFRRHPSPLRR